MQTWFSMVEVVGSTVKLKQRRALLPSNSTRDKLHHAESSDGSAVIVRSASVYTNTPQMNSVCRMPQKTDSFLTRYDGVSRDQMYHVING